MIVKRKAKYLHIIWHPDLKYIPKLVRMINTEKTYFNAKEHLFITPHKRVYDELSKEYEIYLYGKESDNLINKYGKYGEWIFVHAINCNKLKLIFTKKKYANKVIWRTWGHDIRPLEYYKGWKRIVVKLFWNPYLKKVRQFKMIAVANDIDLVNVENTFGKISNCVLKYSYDPVNDKIIENQYKFKKKKGKNIRILIGHSASELDCHIEVMQSILKYKEENILLCLILSYAGPKEYIAKVKNYAINNFGNKVEIIENFMNYEEYIEYLSNIDIAIFAQEHSTALSNVYWLLYFGKTIYFKQTSDFAQSFRRNGCEFCKVEDIPYLNFQQFIERKNSKELIQQYGVVPTSKACCENWKKVLDELGETQNEDK